MGITRRGIGGGLALGLGEGLSNFAQGRVKKRQLADEQTAKAAEGQDKFAQLLLTKLLEEKDPTQQGRLAGFAQANGMDVGPLAPTADQRLAPLLASLGGQSDPTKLPPDATLAARSVGIDTTPGFGLTGQSQGQDGALPSRSLGPINARPVQDIQTLLKAKQDQIAQRETDTGANLQSVTSFNPVTLTDEQQFLPKAQLPGQTFQQKPTPGQAGTMETQQAQAGKLSPDYVASETQAANALESGTRGEKVRTAGATAGAEAQARVTVEFDPRTIAAAAQKAGEIAKADAVARGDSGRLKYIETAKQNGVLLGVQLARLQQLWAKAAKGDLQAASLYRDLSNNLRPVVARATGYNGRMTNAELGIAGGAIPGFKDFALGTADTKWKALRGMATYGPKVAAELPVDAPIEEYMAAVQRLVDGETPDATATDPAAASARQKLQSRTR